MFAERSSCRENTWFLAAALLAAACDSAGAPSGADSGPETHGLDAGDVEHPLPGADAGSDAGDGAQDAAMDGGDEDAGQGLSPHWDDVDTLARAEVVRVSWNHRAPDAYYSLDVRGSGGTWFGPCVDAAQLTDRLSWDFDGRCPSAGGADVRSIDRVRVCSSRPVPPATWDAGSVECTEAEYAGGTTLHVGSAEDLADTVVLRWPTVPDARYALHLELGDGTLVDNCAAADVLGRRTSFAFHGACPSQPGLGAVPLASVARYVVDYAAGSHWENAASRGSASLVTDGESGDHALEFANYRNWTAEEGCGMNTAADYRFGNGTSLAAETCTAAEPGYQKRRLPQRDQYRVAAYPRSYVDSDGTAYVLFATPPGGFTPAGNTGCSELNLLVTRNWVDYEVAQIERLCGYSRLDNGELTVIDGKLYVIYHTITGDGGCTASGDVPGRDWEIRLKVSSNYRDSARTFTDLGGGAGYDKVTSLCLPNASEQGFWEPMVYQAGDGSFRVAYTDDTPPETSDGQCNQYIRIVEYSTSERRVLSNEPVGDCPGDKRDGMPVVMKASDGSYAMVIESLGAPSSQIVLFESTDGVHFGPRQVIADTAVDGGQGVGCPYLAFDGTTPYVSYYHTYASESGAKLGAFRVRSLDASGARRADRLFELRRHWDAADDLDILYWGSIRLAHGRLHAVASSWSHPFTEAWLPLIGD